GPGLVPHGHHRPRARRLRRPRPGHRRHRPPPRADAAVLATGVRGLVSQTLGLADEAVATPAPRPGGPAVVLRDVRRRFGSRVVLDGIDLDIGRDEFVALLGRSGSGKSTLLRALAGLDPDYEGSVQ